MEPDLSNHISPFERVLLQGDLPFLYNFFNSWTPDLIWRIRILNFIFCNIVDYYIVQAWDPDRFYNGWFPKAPDARQFRKILNSYGAIVVGATPFRFFDRHCSTEGELDVMTRGRGLMSLGLFLRDAGYTFFPPRHDSAAQLSASLASSARRSRRSEAADGMDLRCMSRPPIMREFRFYKTDQTRSGLVFFRYVRLRLLRVDPVRFLLCMQSSKKFVLS
jgi:hypothetical protein